MHEVALSAVRHQLSAYNHLPNVERIGGDILYLNDKVIGLDEFIETLKRHPDEAFICNNDRVAYVFDTERDAILCLIGDFQGKRHRDEVAQELRDAMAEQHPTI